MNRKNVPSNVPSPKNKEPVAAKELRAAIFTGSVLQNANTYAKLYPIHNYRLIFIDDNTVHIYRRNDIDLAKYDAGYSLLEKSRTILDATFLFRANDFI